MTIETVRSRKALGETVRGWREAGLSAGLVPTMGALHDGHLALLKAARETCDRVCATLFVNPTQFGPNEDFQAYPRNEESDSKLLADAGCDLLFAPDVAEMYPDGAVPALEAGDIGKRWEGEHRPGHFDGVATVVERLLRAAGADRAFFGEKDYQQLQVIKQMAAAQGIETEIVAVATVREADGLALSSRNAYLTADERAIAPKLHQALQGIAHDFSEGKNAATLTEKAVAGLLGAGFGGVDYLAVVDATTLEPLERFDAACPARVLVAAKLGRARLIDNLSVA